MIWLAVAIGGALGALARFSVGYWLQPISSTEPNIIQFPIATLFVNCLGAFFIGFVFAYFLDQSQPSPFWRSLIITGFLGSLTTFSTFSLEIMTLIERGAWSMAVAYFGLSVLGCVVLTFVGFSLYRWI